MYDLVDRPVDQLPAFERRALGAIRRWVHAYSIAGIDGAGDGDAPADPFGTAMRLIDGGSSDDLVIGRPCQSFVGESEAVLVALWRLVESGEGDAATGLAAMIVDASRAGPLVAAIGAGLRG